MRSKMTILLIFFAMIFSIDCSKPTGNSGDTKEVPKSEVSIVKQGGIGYKDYRWGMTSSDVIAINPEAKKINKTQESIRYMFSGVQYYAMYEGLKKFNYSETMVPNPLVFEKGKLSYIETKDEVLGYLFVDDKLRSIRVYFKKLEEDPLSSIFDKYGKREIKGVGMGNAQWETCSWEDGDRFINYSSMMPRGALGYDVEYMDKDWANVLYAKVAEEAEKKLKGVKSKID